MNDCLADTNKLLREKWYKLTKIISGEKVPALQEGVDNRVRFADSEIILINIGLF